MQKLISVIIPVYNCRKFVSEAIMSVINQPYHNIEIICIDDGSTDDSLLILQKLKKQYDFIQIVTQTNSGVSVARNKGIELVNGEYIAFLDADDLWVPNFLTEEKVTNWGKNAYDVVSFLEIRSNENLTKFTEKIFRQEKECLGGNDSIWCVSSHMCACFYSQKLLKQFSVKFFEQYKYGEDTAFRLMCLYFSNKIYVSNELMYVYRRNSDSALNNIKEDVLKYYLDIVNQFISMENYINSKKISEKGVVTFGTASIGIYFIDMAKAYFELNNSVKNYKKFIKRTPYYNQFCSLDLNIFDGKHRKEYELLINHPKLFCIKYQIIGVVKKIAYVCLKLKIIQKIRDFVRYKGINPFK